MTHKDWYAIKPSNQTYSFSWIKIYFSNFLSPLFFGGVLIFFLSLFFIFSSFLLLSSLFFFLFFSFLFFSFLQLSIFFSFFHLLGEETRRKLHKNVESSIEQILATTPHEIPTIRTLAPHHENYTSKTNQTRGTLLEKQGRAHKWCTPMDPHIWPCKSRTTSSNLHTATMWGHRM